MTKDLKPTEDPNKNLPAAFDYGDDVGQGFEGAKTSDFLTPILDIVQDNSKEVKKRTIEGIRAGFLIIRALGEIFDPANGVAIVPVARNKCYMVWKPVDDGGGLVDRMAEDNPIAMKLKAENPFGKVKMADGNDMVETFELFALLCLPDSGTRRVVIPFASTKINAYRGLMTKAQNILAPTPNGGRVVPPLFAHKYLLKTVFVEKGSQSWWNYSSIGFAGGDAVEARLDPRGGVYQQAKLFYQQVKEGKVQVDTTGMDQADGPDGHAAPDRGGDQDLGEEAPF